MSSVTKVLLLLAFFTTLHSGFCNEDETDDGGRLFFPVIVPGAGGATGASLNLSTVAAVSAIMASGLVMLLGLTALAFLFLTMANQPGYGYHDYGYAGTGGYGNREGYSSYHSAHRR